MFTGCVYKASGTTRAVGPGMTKYTVITLRIVPGYGADATEHWLVAYTGPDRETADRICAREREAGHEAHVVVRTQGAQS